MTVDEAIVDVFERRSADALFVTEVQCGIAQPCDAAVFSAALARLVERGELIVVTKPSPDVHLGDADLRIAARVAPGAYAAVETTWLAWLRDFLSTHRCS